MCLCTRDSKTGSDLLGNLGHVSAKEPGISDDGVLVEGLDPGPGEQRGPGLIEGNVAIGSNASDKELDATGFLNQFLITFTLCIEVSSVAIQDVSVIWVNVDVLYKITDECLDSI